MRRGAALPVALFTLALLGALAVSGSFVSSRLATSSGNVARAADAASLAEGAVVQVVAQWDTAARDGQRIGETAPVQTGQTTLVDTEAWITRIGVRTYSVVAESRIKTRSQIGRRIGLVVIVDRGAVYPLPARAWSEIP